MSKMDEGILITVGGNGSRMTVPCQGKQVIYFARISDAVNILKDDVQFSYLTCVICDDCICRFNPELALKKLRGKRLLFVGDSLQRGQWQSFVCLVEWIIPEDKKSMKQGRSHTVFRAKVLEISRTFLDFFPRTTEFKHHVSSTNSANDSNQCFRNMTLPLNSTGLHFSSNPTPMTIS